MLPSRQRVRPFTITITITTRISDGFSASQAFYSSRQRHRPPLHTRSSPWPTALSLPMPAVAAAAATFQLSPTMSLPPPPPARRPLQNAASAPPLKFVSFSEYLYFAVDHLCQIRPPSNIKRAATAAAASLPPAQTMCWQRCRQGPPLASWSACWTRSARISRIVTCRARRVTDNIQYSISLHPYCPAAAPPDMALLVHVHCAGRRIRLRFAWRAASCIGATSGT